MSNKTKGAFSKRDEDLELVSACQAGDDDAFERLVRKYQKEDVEHCLQDDRGLRRSL